jgi:hypothetical protein
MWIVAPTRSRKVKPPQVRQPPAKANAALTEFQKGFFNSG